MWPWTHLAFGYLSHSVATRVTLGRRPTDAPVLIALVASLLPDLVDKPLAWTFGVTTSGFGPAHSILVGFPLVVLVAVFLWWTWRLTEHAIALGAGYSSHLVGDILFESVEGGRFVGSVVLWPLGPPRNEANAGALAQTIHYLLTFAGRVRDGEATGYAFATLAIVLGVAVLWVLDGKPGIPWLRRTDD